MGRMVKYVLIYISTLTPVNEDMDGNSISRHSDRRPDTRNYELKLLHWYNMSRKARKVNNLPSSKNCPMTKCCWKTPP